jgi:hypothetical protein
MMENAYLGDFVMLGGGGPDVRIVRDPQLLVQILETRHVPVHVLSMSAFSQLSDSIRSAFGQHSVSIRSAFGQHSALNLSTHLCTSSPCQHSVITQSASGQSALGGDTREQKIL